MGLGAFRELTLRMRQTGVEATTASVNGLLASTSKIGPTWMNAGVLATRAAMGATIAIGAVTAATTAAAVQTFRTGAQLERYKVQLTTVLKSEAEATKLLAYIRQQAMATPFELPELIEAATRLEQFGLATETTLGIVADAAGALNRPIEQAALAVSKLTFGETEMIKEFGITVSKIEAELGKPWDRSTIEGMREGVRAALKVMQDETAGGAARLALTTTGILSNISDWFFNFRSQVAQGGYFDVLKKDLQSVYGALQDFDRAGGVDAIATGFNNAFVRIHRVFVEPLRDDLDELGQRDMATLALRTELAVLRITRSANELSGVFAAPFAVLTTGMSKLEAMRDIPLGPKRAAALAEIPVQQLKAMNDAVQATQARTAGLTTRIEALNAAQDLLATGAANAHKAVAASMQAGPPTELQANIAAIIADFDRLTTTAQHAASVLFGGLLEAKPTGRGFTDFFKGEGTKAFETDEQIAERARAQAEKEKKYRLEARKRADDELLRTAGDVTARLQQKREEEPPIMDPQTSQLVEMGELHKAVYLEMSDDVVEYADLTMGVQSKQFTEYVALLEVSRAATATAFANMGRYSEVFATKGMNLGRAMNAALIRGAGEAAKAMIETKIHQAKVDAQFYAAEALAALAFGDVKAAGLFAAAAAKKAALAGLGVVAQAVIERETRSREEDLIGGDTGQGAFGEEPGKFRRARQTGSDTIRHGNVVNNFYISITHHIGHDYVVANEKTDAALIQELLDSNLVVTRG